MNLQNVMGKHGAFMIIMLCSLLFLPVACDSNSSVSSTNIHHTLSTTDGNTITYSTSPQEVLIRTFYGGGRLGTFEMSPDISIYGDGTYILGPGLQMLQGQIQTDQLQQLLNGLVNTYGLLKLNRQQFYDVPDQNASLLQLMLNGKQYEFLYGPFGNLQESAQDLDEYHRLGNALTSITEALRGPTHSYTNSEMALLVHQIFNVDPNQNIPSWTFRGFTLYQLATYECGPVPPDETGPNADTGCLTFTVPRTALLLNTQQLREITTLMNGQQQRVFLEGELYYSVVLRPLLPDEKSQMALAMLGSQELNYAGVPLHQGPVPTPTPK